MAQGGQKLTADPRSAETSHPGLPGLVRSARKERKLGLCRRLTRFRNLQCQGGGRLILEEGNLPYTPIFVGVGNEADQISRSRREECCSEAKITLSKESVEI